MTNKINIDLKGVPQTLLLPLLCRAEYSQKPYSPLHDEYALKLVRALNYDFNHLLQKVGDTPLFGMARAYHFDNAIKGFLARYEKATIVNLGAGLDTSFVSIQQMPLT